MIIRIDYNNDEITIDSDTFKITGRMTIIQKILEEIFNRIDYTRLSSATPYLDIILERMDEDRIMTIGEW